MRVRLAVLAALAAAVSPVAMAQPSPCVDGDAGGYGCDRVDLVAHFTPQELGAPPVGPCPNPYPGLCANDVWGWADPDTGRRYAIVGLAVGTAFVDVTTPSAPVRLGMLPTATVGSSWRDVKALGNVALIVSEAPGHGIQVFDLTKLRGLTEDAGRRFSADARYVGVGSAHNIVVNEGARMAYAVGSRAGSVALPATCNARGLHAVDFSDPLAPAFAGCFSDAIGGVDSGYTHDAQCVAYDGPDADYAGRQICFGFDENEVSIFDATDPANAVVISRVGYPTPAYTHQGWLTEDGRYLLVNDELDEANAVNGGDATPQRTLVLDVEDLDAPGVLVRLPVRTGDHRPQPVRARRRRLREQLRGGPPGPRPLADRRRHAGGGRVLRHVPARHVGQLCRPVEQLPLLRRGARDRERRRDRLLRAPGGPRTGGRGGPAPTPTTATLTEPRPNPTAGVARLGLTVDRAQTVRATLVDVAGREVARSTTGPPRPPRS